MTNQLQIVSQIYPEVKIERPGPGGDLQVSLDGQPIVTIHYVYGWIDNATQHSLAEQIAKLFRDPIAAITPPILEPTGATPDQPGR